MSEDDEDAFRRAMADVRPLPARKRAPAGPRPRVASRLARAERDNVLLETPHAGGASETVAASDALGFRRHGVREDVMRRLRRGQFPVAAEIDLHGMRRHEAHDALRDFLGDCVVRGLGCVRVIHGKGLRSGDAGPVLKQVVDLWLRRIDNVQAFVSARPADGGTGAVYVLLAPATRPKPARPA